MWVSPPADSNRRNVLSTGRAVRPGRCEVTIACRKSPGQGLFSNAQGYPRNFPVRPQKRGRHPLFMHRNGAVTPSSSPGRAGSTRFPRLAGVAESGIAVSSAEVEASGNRFARMLDDIGVAAGGGVAMIEREHAGVPRRLPGHDVVRSSLHADVVAVDARRGRVRHRELRGRRRRRRCPLRPSRELRRSRSSPSTDASPSVARCPASGTGATSRRCRRTRSTDPTVGRRR